jgi:predicted RNA-binding protein with PIN domain
MKYLIDGYNFIFALDVPHKSLQTLREAAIAFLRPRFLRKKLSGTIVFDGAERGYQSDAPLHIAYAPKGQSADGYILEMIAGAKNPKEITVVSNDRGLGRQAAYMGAKIISVDAFIKFLMRIKAGTAKEPKESATQIDRLLKIFEERFREE